MKKIALTTIGLLLSVNLAIAGDHSDFSYKGEKAPNYWSKLSSANILCNKGGEQSPVQIKGISAVRRDINFDYNPATLNIKDTDHGLVFNYSKGSELRVDNDIFELSSFHFHAPSENMIGDKPFPMELHLVHKDIAGGLAVVGIFIKEGKENKFLEILWDNWPDGPNNNVVIDAIQLNALGLLPTDKAFYSFMGSLTTPPCLEKVRWYLLAHPIEASSAQIDKFRKEIKDGQNARPVQPLNDRVIK